MTLTFVCMIAPSTPVVPVQAAVLHGFGDVFGFDAIQAAEVGDGAGDFEDAVVRARRQAHAAHGHLERALAGVVQRAEPAWQVLPDVSVKEGAGGLGSRGLAVFQGEQLIQPQPLGGVEDLDTNDAVFVAQF